MFFEPLFFLTIARGVAKGNLFRKKDVERNIPHNVREAHTLLCLTREQPDNRRDQKNSTSVVEDNIPQVYKFLRRFIFAN